MPYTPTWNYPYTTVNNPYQQQQITPTVQYPMPYQQPSPHVQQGAAKVDGPTEAMNRFLMRYPANQLVPGFLSEPMFDVNGKQFYTLSIEADGRRNLETFDFFPHVQEAPVQIDGAQFVSRREFDEFAAKVNAVLGAANGLHGTVPAAPAATSAAADGNAQVDTGGRHVGTGAKPIPD